ncbi:MAG: hypothetical protein IE912_04125 [Brevundimonas diminuta]|nr:hypothetical protein [Brevundimonas diminuta]MBD3818085.1 hypothetical protein [Brevundimonas diminuta]
MSQLSDYRSAYVFDDFPEDDAVWEVVMYGAVDSTSVAWMGEVLLADWRWRFGDGSQPLPKMRLLRRALGDVAGLPIGSRWRNGEPVPDKRGPQIATIEVDRISGLPTYKLGDADPTGKKADRPSYPVTGFAEAPVWQIKSGPADRYYVPAMELIRYVFGGTASFLKLTVEGGHMIAPTFRRQVFDASKSGRALDDPSTVHIAAYRPLSRYEAEIVARIVTNPQMHTAFRRVFASVQTATAGKGRIYPETIYPYDQPTKWHVEWRWSRVTPGEWRKLITRIHAIEAPLDVKRIVVSLTGGEERQDEEKRRPVSRRRGTRGAEPLRILPDQPSSSNLVEKPLNSQHTHHDPGFLLEHVIIKDGEPNNVVVIEGDTYEVTAGSSTWSFGTKQKVTPINWMSKSDEVDDPPRPPSEWLMATRAAVEKASEREGWACAAFPPPMGPGAKASDGLHRYPKHDDGESPLSWSEVNDGRSRRCLVMEVALPEGHVYVFDAERLDDRADGDDRRALGLVLVPTGWRLNYEDIQALLAVNAAAKGVWRQADVPSSYRVETRPRNGSWQRNIHAYAHHIRSRIRMLARTRSMRLPGSLE